MKCDNNKCAYDLRQNSLALRVEIHTRAFLGPRMRIHCPVCGSPLVAELDLQILGLCLRDIPPHVRWKDSPHLDSLFQFSDADALSAEEICFTEVPMLGGVTPEDQRRVQVPDLPVRPEYLDLLDMVRYHKTPDEFRGRIDPNSGRYVARLPLRGHPQAVRIERPLVNVRWEKTLRPTDDPIQDTLVCIWPKVRAKQWKTFIVDVELPPSALGEPEVHVRLHQGVKAQTEENAELPVMGTYRVRSLEFTGYVANPQLPRRFAAIFKGPRPELVSVSWRKSDRFCGGTFVAAPPLDLGPSQDDILNMGVDFGTSSSCVAFQWHGAPRAEVPPVADTFEYLVRPRETHAKTPAANYHPRLTHRPYGRHKEILPSELLLREALGNPDAASDLRPGLDICVPGNDVEWDGSNPPDKLLIKDLKWGDSAFNRACRVAYLKTLLVQTLAATLSAHEQGINARTPARINVRWSYPGIWRPEEVASLRDSFRKAMNTERALAQGARWALSDWTETTLELHAGPKTEAFAVSHLDIPTRGHDLPAVVYRPRVILDVGGGSTDIAFLWVPTGPGRPHIIEYMVSLKYAGSALFDGLAGSDRPSNCFVDGNARTAERRLRADGPRSEYFAPDREKARTARISLYVHQLVEFVARLVASTVLSGSATRRNPDLSSSDMLPVQIVRLGNGLGLASLVYDNLDESLRAHMQRRVDDLIGQGRPKTHVDIFAIPNCDPKHAVCLGLLSDHQAVDKARYLSATSMNPDGLHDTLVDSVPPWTFRTILGLGVTTRQGGADKQIEWWRETSSLSKDGTYHPQEWAHGPTGLDPQSPARWLHDAPAGFVPGFPPEFVGTDGDDFLKTLRVSDQYVQACVPNGRQWFGESPFEKLLQTSLKDRLKQVRG